jgi:pimeloyl-ACP methyl ester carboxylesterase
VPLRLGENLFAQPARDYPDAVARFEALRALDGPRIIARAHSRFYSHLRRTELAVVLIHGFTNVPEQWSSFAAQLHARGHSVVVPRLPGHGDADRETTAIARLRARELLASVNEAVDIARGAGERVAVAGLSIGGAMSAWLALRRTDVSRAVAIVPLFGLARFGARANAALVNALKIAPSAFVPWDPGAKDTSEIPSYGYPRFSTRALGECLRIGLDVYDASASESPPGPVTMLLNPLEPACNNRLAVTVAERFARRRAGSADTVFLRGLPANHDIIDPTNPHARVDLVYPKLLELLES